MDASHPVAGTVHRAMGGDAFAIDDAAAALHSAELEVIFARELDDALFDLRLLLEG